MSFGSQRKLRDAADLCAGTGLKLFGLAGALLIAGCGDDRFPDYRYKMTVVVATPDGEKSYSSVREVRQEEKVSVLDSSGRSVKAGIEGEAVILDLPGGQTVYALLSEPDRIDYPKYIAAAALLPMVRKPERDERTDDLTSKPGEYLDRRADEQQAMVKVAGARELPRERTVNSLGVPLDKPLPLWPRFVTFDDPQDPKTIRVISLESIGVQRITIEITDEPVTTGIEERLPFGKPNTGFNEWYQSLDYDDPRKVSRTNFVVRENK